MKPTLFNFFKQAATFVWILFISLAMIMPSYAYDGIIIARLMNKIHTKVAACLKKLNKVGFTRLTSPVNFDFQVHQMLAKIRLVLSNL